MLQFNGNRRNDCAAIQNISLREAPNLNPTLATSMDTVLTFVTQYLLLEPQNDTHDLKNTLRQELLIHIVLTIIVLSHRLQWPHRGCELLLEEVASFLPVLIQNVGGPSCHDGIDRHSPRCDPARPDEAVVISKKQNVKVYPWRSHEFV